MLALTLYVLLAFAGYTLVKAPCVPRKTALICRDHIRLVDIEAHPRAKAIIFAGIVAGSGCVPLHNIQLVLPDLKYVDVSSKPGPICECLLGSSIPCGVKLSGCTRSTLEGKCPPPVGRASSSTIPVVIGVGAIMLIAILGAAGGFGYYRMQKRMRQMDTTYQKLEQEMTTFNLHHAAINQDETERNRDDEEDREEELAAPPNTSTPVRADVPPPASYFLRSGAKKVREDNV